MTEARRILWLQPDDLYPTQLTEEDWDHVIYIFDPEWLRLRPHSLKQVQFIVESIECLPKPVSIYRGHPTAVLASLRHVASDLTALVTPRDNELLSYIQSLPLDHPLTWLPPAQWLSPPSGSYTRFFKYWNAVKKQI